MRQYAILQIHLAICLFTSSEIIAQNDTFQAKSLSSYRYCQIIESNEKGIIVEFNFPGLHLNKFNDDGHAHHIAHIDGFSQTTEAGKPQLPYKGYLFGIPQNARTEMKILSSEHITLNHKNLQSISPKIDSSNPIENVLQSSLLNYSEAKHWKTTPVTSKMFYKRHNRHSNQAWYKILVEHDGIYVIDKNKMEEIGYNLANIDPQQLRILTKVLKSPSM